MTLLTFIAWAAIAIGIAIIAFREPAYLGIVIIAAAITWAIRTKQFHVIWAILAAAAIGGLLVLALNQA